MSGIRISQVRWPVEVYEWLQELAHEKRQSINKTVVEIIGDAKKHLMLNSKTIVSEEKND